MADIAASVLTRLKNKAQASGRSYQLSLKVLYITPSICLLITM